MCLAVRCDIEIERFLIAKYSNGARTNKVTSLNYACGSKRMLVCVSKNVCEENAAAEKKERT